MPQVLWKIRDVLLNLALAAAVCLIPEFGKANQSSWSELVDSAKAQIAAGNFDSSNTILRVAICLASQKLDPSDTSIIRLTLYLGQCHQFAQKYSESEAYYREVLQQAIGPSATERKLASKGRSGLAAVYLEQGNPATAESLLVAEATHLRECGDSCSLRYSDALIDLANLYTQINKRDSADLVFSEAIAIRRRFLAPDDPEIAYVLNSQGENRYFHDDMNGAIESFRQAYEVVRDNHKVNAEEAAWPVQNLFSVYKNIGEFATAESLLAVADNIYTDRASTSNLGFAKLKVQQAHAQIDLGYYAKAEARLLFADSLIRALTDSSSVDLYHVFDALGRVYASVNFESEARYYYHEAIRILTIHGGPENEDMYYPVNNLGDLELACGNLSAAELLFVRSLQIGELSFDSQSTELLLPLENLVIVNMKQGEFETAEQYAWRAYRISVVAFGREHPTTGRLTLLLGVVTSQSGRRNHADSLFNEGIATLRWFYPEGHPQLADGLEQRRDHELRSSHFALALASGIESFWMRLNSFRANAAFLPEPVAMRYAFSTQSAASWCGSIWRQMKNPGKALTDSVAAVLLNAKGIVTEVSASKERHPDEDSATTSTRGELRRAKFALSNQYLTVPEKVDSDEFRHRRDSIARVIGSLEARLGRSLIDRGASFSRATTLQEMSASLLPGTVAIEYFKLTDSTSGRRTFRYLAAVLRKDMPARLIDLGPARIIDSIIRGYRQHLDEVSRQATLPTPADLADYRATATRIFEALLKPILAITGAPHHLIVAPDADMNLVSLASLPTDSTHFFIESTTVVYATSLRDFALSSVQLSGAGVLAIGNPKFDATAGERREAMLGGAANATSKTVDAGAPRKRGGCLQPGNLNEPPLPQSARELTRLSEKWKALSDRVTILDGATASEDQFKRLAPGKRILHLSTHGYFMSPECMTPANSRLTSYVNPLLNSGILFAGCNLLGKESGQSDLDDGILSALEVSALDLAGVELVVLSACESGLGDARQGEGVWGLRRAFQLAGARQFVTALWPVDDRMSADLMGRVYDDLSLGIAENLRRAQLLQIQKLRTTGIPEHPYLWGAFIAQGRN